MAFIIGGIVGLILVASVFNWALYILSSWAGATLITQTIAQNAKLDSNYSIVIFFVLFVLGMIIQAGLFREQAKKKPVDEKPEVLPPQKDS